MQGKFERRLDIKLLVSIIATGLMSFTGIVIETAMNVTFPTLMNEFNVSISTVQWITTGYLLILAMIIPSSAYLKKKYTSKKIFITASLIFLTGTLLGAFASSFAMLLMGRLLQGAGTGIALPLMFNIVMEQAPQDKIGLMMGTATLVVAMAPAVGPSVGGMIVNEFGWRMIFISLVPILILSLIFGIISIRQSSQLRDETFPLMSYLMLSASFFCFILGSSFAGSLTWLSTIVIALFVASGAFIFIFCRISIKLDNPLIHLQVFSNKKFSLCVIGLLLLQFICLGIGFLIPNFAQIVLGENAFIAGCILLPGCLLGAILAPISGQILDRFGARRPILIGCIFVIISLSAFNFELVTANALVLAEIYAIFTLGQGFTSGNTMVSGLQELLPEFKPDGNAIFNTLQQLAGAIGTAMISTIVASPQQQISNFEVAIQQGSQNAFMVLLVVSIIEFICMNQATMVRK